MDPQLQNQESYHRGSSAFSYFESTFFQLIQTMLDPPIEIPWFYSTAPFHATKWSAQNKPFHPSGKLVIAKDLLILLISCSILSTESKKIALLAPMVYELYNFLCDSRKSDQCEKIEVYKLVEDMVIYVMMSAGVYNYGNEDVQCDNGVVCFEDMIQVWTSDRGGVNCNSAESLRIFFSSFD